ncbi:ATP-grasp fold amidoligase family protein [Brevibacterium casei]|uniref:ATP-grasp fold amidoligase family protein n=1 Tax=Brevibacterium casei TaxID=33889 RepID=UPI0018D2E705|nr:ATP-grasp fold amidoligase family protein [Brevibacterium casei]
MNDKYRLNRFCLEHSIPAPKVSQAWKTPDDLDFSTAPETFVLKPSVMHSAKGVMLLSQTNDADTYYESLSKRNLSTNEIRSIQKSVYDACKFKGSYRLLIEERITSPGNPDAIPLDYKVFCFYDKIGVISQINRNTSPKELLWYDGAFEPLATAENIVSDWDTISVGKPQTPQDPGRMIDIAIRISKLLKTPFMSVDMFESSRGPVVGELTPAPGAAYYGDWYQFSDALNLKLGELWDDAADKLSKSK